MTLREEPGRNVDIKTLLDSGATQSLIHKNFVFAHRIPIIELVKPIIAYNADGTPNKAGAITSSCYLEVALGSHVMQQRFLIADIGNERAILGMDWLKTHNPNVDWRKGLLTFRGPPAILRPLNRIRTMHAHWARSWKECKERVRLAKLKESIPPEPESIRVVLSNPEPDDEEEDPFHPLDPEPDYPNDDFAELLDPSKTKKDSSLLQFPEAGPPQLKESWELDEMPYTRRIGTIPGRISARRIQGGVLHARKVKPAEEMAKDHAKTSPKKSLEEMVPAVYLRDYADLFGKKAAERFPTPRPWDHRINLKPDFVPFKSDAYKLNPLQEKAMNDFVDENLAKGYIEPSDSPMASSLFFVGKKDGSLRPCQDYRKLNEGTIRDQYPLPIIADLIDQAREATVFSKLDLRSGYNNVQIIPEDRHKAAFISVA